MNGLLITKEQARQFLAAYHGLRGEYQYIGKQGILDYIMRVGSIQFDTLDIVGRNPELVLQSRIKSYRSKYLNELLYKDYMLLDQWDKEMSIYPTQDWPFFARNRIAAYERYKDIQAIKDSLSYVRDAIEQKGPVTSSDLELDEIIDWSWAPTRLSRAALESMYLWGELIVWNKLGSRKVYDFAYKHIPQQILQMPDPNTTQQQYHEWHVLRRIRAVGLLWNKASDAWLGIREMKSPERNRTFIGLLERNAILEIKVADVKYPLYMDIKYKDLLDSVLKQEGTMDRGAILAPLDNLLWDRKLIRELFGFEYVWEVYKPAAQRKYGYYVLPILYGSSFVARFEPVLDKERKLLIIKNWWWEAEVKGSASMKKALKRCITEFMKFQEAKGLEISEKAMAEAKLDWLL